MQSRTHRSKRSNGRPSAIARAVESLESRQLLAASAVGNVFDVARTPVFTPSTDSLRDAKSGPLAKGGGALVQIADEYRKYIKSGGKASQFASQFDDTYVMNGNMLGVTLRTRGSFDGLVRTVRNAGGYLIARSRAFGVVDAFVPIGQIRGIASQDAIAHVRPLAKPVTGVGAATNEAVTALNTANLSAALGLDGTGVKIGVISDSANQRGSVTNAQQSGDLPQNVELVADGTSTFSNSDEGAAMLELIHDIAPGAELAFHSCGDSLTTFSGAITALAEAGCDVIIDDLSYVTNPAYQSGIAGEALSAFVKAGGVYFTNQSNFGTASFETFADWTTGGDGVQRHDFDTRSGRTDTRISVTFETDTNLVLNWDNPYNGVTGDVTADLDIYFYQDNQLVGASTDNNIATGIPQEFLSVPAGTYDIEIAVGGLAAGATLPTTIRFSSFGSPAFDGRALEYKPTIGTSLAFGHGAAADSVGVGAVDEDDTVANGAISAVSQEFSSSGPGRLMFKENGQRRKSPLTTQNPLIAGVDGTVTTVPGFENFEGTSAASPNIAAIATLLLQAKPDATAADIRAALVAGARDNPVNGQARDSYDPQAGYGLVDAVRAAAFLLGDNAPVYATIDRPEQNPKSNGINAVTVRFSAPVSGVDRSDFDLFLDDPAGADRVTSKVGVEQIDSQTYRLTGLRARTQELGTYFVAVNGAGITDGNGDPVAGFRTSFRNELRPPTNLRAEAFDDGSIRLSWDDINPAETSWRIIRSTDPSFIDGTRQTFTAAANATSYLDTSARASTTYYYRVQAVRDGQLGNIAYTSANSLSAGERIVDVGSSSVENGTSGVGLRFFDDERAYGGSAIGTSVQLLETGAKPSAAFVDSGSATLGRGEYFVYARWINNGNNASNVKYKVRQTNATDGTSRDVASFTLNQSAKRAAGWVVLGKVKLDPKKSTFIRTDVRDATNETVVDAFRFLPANTAGLDEFGEPIAASIGGSPVAGRLVAGPVVTSNFSAERITAGVLRIGPRGVIFE
jgi:hypothetical protein